jgi:DNA invertase Pin-like site-specific DNA recombinase
LEQGRADGLIVAKLDRLGRSVADVAGLVDRAMAQGWSLVVLDPALDLSTAAGRLTAHVLGAVAEMEAEMVAERTAAIVEMKREQGKSLGGRPSSLPPEVVDRIVAEREHSTLQAIADGLNLDGVPTAQGGSEWRPSSVAAVLKRKE